MNYYEVQFTITPNTEDNRDVLAALLADAGYESFSETEVGSNAYVRQDEFSTDAVEEAIREFPLENTTISFKAELVISKDWNEEWEKNFFQPILIGDQCVIHSSFHQDIPALPYDIVIDPKMAFGTGHHETTSLMVSFILDREFKGKSFLDMGCGTAVLAILANMKGAHPVLAIDIDEWATENSLENIRLNHTPDIRVQLGGAELLGSEMFDIIFANINRNILLADIKHYTACMSPGSELYMSGFYVEDIPVIREECEKYNLQFLGHIEKNNWAAVHFIKE